MKPRRASRPKSRRPKSSAFGGPPASVLPLSPPASEPLSRVYLSTPLAHPLVYKKRIVRSEGELRPGHWVAVYVEPDLPLGFGIYNPRSEIAVRMFRPGEQPPDEPFWDRQIQSAITLRRDLLKLDEVADAYRLIHSEADGLSGIVVDRFGDVLSAEIFSLGMWQRAEQLLERIAPHLGTKHWRVQPSPMLQPQEGLNAVPFASADAPDQITIQEFGTRFRVHFNEGHKTGFFCDQRDNRHKLATFCKDKTVLDLCCYSGGFAVQAKRLGQAAEVIGVDLDEAPLKLARENAALNQCRVKFVQADVFPYMRDMLRSGQQFDVVVLDPPKLIRSRAELEEGTRKHFDLNRLAMQLVRPGGLLLSCTCAGLLEWEAFLRLLYAAARQAGDPLPGGEEGPFSRRGPRPMQIIEKTGAAADHPIAGNCPETEYLRAVWMRLG